MNFDKTDKRRFLILIAAFAAVYIFWGSTYIAIKYAIETLPPFIMAGTRFLFAGAVLFALAAASRDFERPSRAHWRTSFIVGTLLLLGGNGGVVFAERYISSSVAALLVATEPFWIVILSWLWLGGARPSAKLIAGLMFGFVGVTVLITGQAAGAEATAGSTMRLLAAFAVIAATVAWATGSIYGLKAPVPKSALLTAGMQMICGGAVLMLVSFPKGEWQAFSPADVSAASWLALAYLTVFGSLIAFTAYSWLLKNAPPSIVATYAYVNPVIAVLLGWGLAGETLTAQMLLGAAFVVVSVVIVTMQKAPVATADDSEELFISAAPTRASTAVQ